MVPFIICIVGGFAVTIFVPLLHHTGPDAQDPVPSVFGQGERLSVDLTEHPLSLLLGTIANAVFIHLFWVQIVHAFPGEPGCSRCWNEHTIPFFLAVFCHRPLTIGVHRFSLYVIERLRD